VCHDERMTAKQRIERFRGNDAPGLVESGTTSTPEFDADDSAVRRARIAG